MGRIIPKVTCRGLMVFPGHALKGHCSKKPWLTWLGPSLPFYPSATVLRCRRRLLRRPSHPYSQFHSSPYVTHGLLLFYLATCDKALFVCILYHKISSFRARDLEGTRLGGVIASGREDSEVPKKWLLNTEELLCVQGAA